MPRTRIVAVDDDRRILRLLERACESIGCEVHSVLDASLFESSFRAFEPALVFLDLNMRNVDGVELLRFIAEQRRGTSVIVTSGMDARLLSAAHALGLSLGLDMLEPIRKPLDVAQVRARVQAFQVRPPSRPVARISRAELLEAISGGRIGVCYQPMLHLGSGRVVGVEALARLRRPGGGLVMPEHFIGVAERGGLIDALTLRVLERAIEDLHAWADVAPDLQLSINVSPAMLTDVTLPDRVSALLARRGLAADRLVVEVTETAVPANRPRMADTLSRLRLKGIHLALDDFGTGFCSLGQLYEFPFEILKLDKKFAIGAERSDEAAAMIRSSLDLARSVGLDVVAEGIQSEDTLRWLGRMGCDLGQGFHISPPLAAQALHEWLLRFDRAPPGLATRLELHALS